MPRFYTKAGEFSGYRYIVAVELPPPPLFGAE